MPTLTILPAGKTIDAAPGTTLLQAVRDAGLAMPDPCGAEAPCGGKCHLFITEGRKAVSRTSAVENGVLDTIVGVSSKSRLACLATLGSEPVTVELLGALSGY